jgi:hypothetical protein
MIYVQLRQYNVIKTENTNFNHLKIKMAENYKNKKAHLIPRWAVI